MKEYAYTAVPESEQVLICFNLNNLQTEIPQSKFRVHLSIILKLGIDKLEARNIRVIKRFVGDSAGKQCGHLFLKWYFDTVSCAKGK